MKYLRSPITKWILLICFLTALFVFVVYQYNSQIWTKIVKSYSLLHDRAHLKTLIRSYGAYSPLAYILLQMTQVVIAPIPGGAIEFIGGYIFGAQAGFLYSMIGLFIGSWFAFSLARIFEKLAVEKFVPFETRKKFDYLIEHEGVILSFVLFLIPGFPKDALCYILGLTPMHLGIFLFISTVGRVPGTLMACLQGAKAFDHQYKTLLILSGISALIILIFYIYHDEIHNAVKKMRGRKGQRS
ncbi:MAG: TVP38/TMEM64 family protein [Thermodesulfobacteriota bacterium]